MCEPFMNSNAEATIDDLYRVRGKAELVRGRIVTMPPAGGFEGMATAAICGSLHDYAQGTKRDNALGRTVGFVVDLPHRKSFCPDASFHVGPLTIKFVDGPPIFAVEIRSEDEYGPAAEEEMAAKRADYFATGSKVVWDVDLHGPDVVRVFRSCDPEHPIIYRRGQLADAEPAVPGWAMPVDDLFRHEQRQANRDLTSEVGKHK
jgi:Uma2 family endonuclease